MAEIWQCGQYGFDFSEMLISVRMPDIQGLKAETSVSGAERSRRIPPLRHALWPDGRKAPKPLCL
jgi:hypothetical protein